MKQIDSGWLHHAVSVEHSSLPLHKARALREFVMEHGIAMTTDQEVLDFLFFGAMDMLDAYRRLSTALMQRKD